MQVLCGLQGIFLLFNCQTPVLTRCLPFIFHFLCSFTFLCISFIILSLTVVGRKNRCIPCIYWATAIFAVVSDYSNLFLSLTFFLDCPHFTFGYELIIRPETTDFVKVICDLFPFVQWDKSLLLYLCKVHQMPPFSLENW